MFEKVKRNSYLILALLVFTMIFCRTIGSCRYSELHQIYKVGIYFCYLLHFLIFAFSFINLFKMYEVGFLKAKNFIYVFLSLSPIFLWIYYLLHTAK